MITDQSFQKEEAKIQEIFAQAGWMETPLPNEARIDLIEERALGERVLKESAHFIFTSFGAVLTSFTSATFGQINDSKEDYKV